MVYKCCECGHMFEDGEQAVWEEARGEFWGFPAKETMTGCPLCKGSYEQTVPCEHCGSMHLEEELVEGWCEDCINKHRYDIELCYRAGEREQTAVAINGFLAMMFNEREIEEILMQTLRESHAHNPVDCSEWFDNDQQSFVEFIKGEGVN